MKIMHTGKAGLVVLPIADWGEMIINADQWQIIQDNVSAYDISNFESADAPLVSTFVLEARFISTSIIAVPALVTESRKLAYAVLRGDDDATFALADEVQMSHIRPESFISRDKLITLLKEWVEVFEGLPLSSIQHHFEDVVWDTKDVLERLK